MEFEDKVLTESNVDFRKCILCGACTSGCPFSDFLDYKPHQIAYMIRLGKKERVLTSRAIWLCATCYLCQERCQKGVMLTELMLYLCRLATKEYGINKRAKTMINLIKKYGRINETRLALAEWGFINSSKRINIILTLARKGKLQFRIKPIVNKEAVTNLINEIVGEEV